MRDWGVSVPWTLTFKKGEEDLDLHTDDFVDAVVIMNKLDREMDGHDGYALFLFQEELLIGLRTKRLHPNPENRCLVLTVIEMTVRLDNQIAL